MPPVARLLRVDLRLPQRSNRSATSRCCGASGGVRPEDTRPELTAESSNPVRNTEHAWRSGLACTDYVEAPVKRVEEWIDVNLTESFSRADLARVAKLDVRTLSRAFLRRHKMAPMQYVRARRLQAARSSLLQADADSTTVTEIALLYGFNHLSRFAADYRRAFGEFPSQTLNYSGPHSVVSHVG